ncbi:hypothetical protein D9M68_723960 [compost metagenome]
MNRLRVIKGKVVELNLISGHAAIDGLVATSDITIPAGNAPVPHPILVNRLLLLPTFCRRTVISASLGDHVREVSRYSFA